MRAQLHGGRLHGVGELHEFARERDFRGRLQCGGGGLAGAGLGLEFAENGADARDGVEQVRGGVALERDHLVPREEVVAGAVLREVGVLHGADADDARDGLALFFGEVGALLVDEA